MRLSVRGLLPLLICATLLSSFVISPAGAGNTTGNLAPAIAITDGINGVTKDTKITDYKGSVTLFVIWLPICPHCQKFMPEVGRLHAKYAQRGLQVVTVTHGIKSYTAKYLVDRKWTFGVGFDWTGVTAKRYGMKGMPGVYLLGADNKLRSYTGTLEQAIVDELPAPAPAPTPAPPPIR